MRLRPQMPSWWLTLAVAGVLGPALLVADAQLWRSGRSLWAVGPPDTQGSRVETEVGLTWRIDRYFLTIGTPAGPDGSIDCPVYVGEEILPKLRPGNVEVLHLQRGLLPSLPVLEGAWTRDQQTSAMHEASNARHGRWSIAPTGWRWQGVAAHLGLFLVLSMGLAAGLAPLLQAWRGKRRLCRGLCPSCAYPIPGVGTRCPECGSASPVSTPTGSRGFAAGRNSADAR